ncbi:hypothetical protein HPB50_010181 [Hyalomma asiaticum]|uniref:Uncharacterized protein n=1 Tax=Hyalomma asiaticum TaxID=266040 RepID=A0ACB7SWZ1_HYAAI|nr:hypothetical protein HPB50_010181 [Hyalomma asiaticum]
MCVSTCLPPSWSCAAHAPAEHALRNLRLSLYVRGRGAPSSRIAWPTRPVRASSTWPPPLGHLQKEGREAARARGHGSASPPFRADRPSERASTLAAALAGRRVHGRRLHTTPVRPYRYPALSLLYCARLSLACQVVTSSLRSPSYVLHARGRRFVPVVTGDVFFVCVCLHSVGLPSTCIWNLCSPEACTAEEASHRSSLIDPSPIFVPVPQCCLTLSRLLAPV